MTFSLENYERSIVFAQRLESGNIIKPLSEYIDMAWLIENNILEHDDSKGFARFENDILKSITFPKMNIKIDGNIHRLVISMIDIDKSDKYFSTTAIKISDLLVDKNIDISGVGVNFAAIAETKNAISVIKSKFIDKCPSIIADADDASFKVVYRDKANKASAIISLGCGILSSETETQEGIILSYNYHRDIKEIASLENEISHFKNCLEDVNLKFESYRHKLEVFLNDK